MVKYQAIILDTWSENAELTCLSIDVIILSDIFKDFAKTPPFSAFVKHTNASDILEKIRDAYADNFFVQTATSGKILAKTSDVVQFHPPLKSLSQIYNRLIKRRVMNAVLMRKTFDLGATLTYFQDFYHKT